MTEPAGFNDQERRLFAQRKTLAPLLAAVALLASGLGAAGFGNLALEIAFAVVLLILGVGVLATEHATRLTRFDRLLDDARMTCVATLRFQRQVLRGLLYGVVIALAFWKGLHGDLAVVAMALLAGAGLGLWAQLLFHREVALLRPIVELP
jgi:hypothetical protein